MNSDRIKLFEHYYSGELSKDDRLAFESQLASDPTLKKEYETFQEVKESLVHANNLRLKHKINEAIEQGNEKVLLERSFPKYIAAASIIIICCLSLYVYFLPSENEALYSEFYQPYSETTSVLSSGKEALNTCLNEYNKEAYLKSLNCLDQISSNSTVYFYQGMCYSNLEDTDQAILSLLKVEELNEVFLEEANWYLALLYLKQNELTKTKNRLNLVITRPNSNYKKKSAKKLYSELDF